ncbi:12503_t:CDS:2 [Dentiscutata erythropus]|uniref:12503_t:CDS:1 n=1 Tax=Dentiscutata erythropus TaxID=1348616 RepID=A0A9N9D6E3_9GLOM|nr:12503_t:CDS:2 [Dentiscutata erythropus]
MSSKSYPMSSTSYGYEDEQQPYKKWFKLLFNAFHNDETAIEFIHDSPPIDFIKIINTKEEQLIKILSISSNVVWAWKIKKDIIHKLDENETIFPGFQYLFKYKWVPSDKNGENDLILTNGKGIFAVVETKRTRFIDKVKGKLSKNKDNKIDKYRKSYVIQQAGIYKQKFIDQYGGAYANGDGPSFDIIAVIGIAIGEDYERWCLKAFDNQVCETLDRIHDKHSSVKSPMYILSANSSESSLSSRNGTNDTNVFKHLQVLDNQVEVLDSQVEVFDNQVPDNQSLYNFLKYLDDKGLLRDNDYANPLYPRCLEHIRRSGNIDRKVQKDSAKHPDEQRSIGWYYDGVLKININGTEIQMGFLEVIAAMRLAFSHLEEILHERGEDYEELKYKLETFGIIVDRRHFVFYAMEYFDGAYLLDEIYPFTLPDTPTQLYLLKDIITILLNFRAALNAYIKK